MKISIITVSRNSQQNIESCIKSVACQTYPDIEHIIIDGASQDQTLAIINRNKDRISKILSEPDDGPYYALNKGIKIASGDVVGILHADDFYANSRVIEKVVKVFEENNVDSCYGDLDYVAKDNVETVIRHWSSGSYATGKFKHGWMPPHCTFFVRKAIYERYGYFNTDYKIAADYELMLKFLFKYGISTYYLPEVLVKMRLGGISNRLGNLARKSSEDYKAWTSMGLKNGFFVIFMKNLIKIPQFLKRP